jgi:hypothetical protein
LVWSRQRRLNEIVFYFFSVAILSSGNAAASFFSLCEEKGNKYLLTDMEAGIDYKRKQTSSETHIIVRNQ